MPDNLLQLAGTLLTVMTPLVAVPLTVITFYLRSLREHQVSWHAELARRVESAEGSINELRKALSEFERDFTTKEEWLRECMLARGAIERLKETATRVEATLSGRRATEGSFPLAGDGLGARATRQVDPSEDGE